MPPDNRDEIGRSLARIIEDLIRDMELSEGTQIIGYTFITRGSSGPPKGSWPDPEDHPPIRWEMGEGEGMIWITASLPQGMARAPSVAVQPHEIRITAGGETSVIPVPSRIDVRSCSWKLANGVLDIVCRVT